MYMTVRDTLAEPALRELKLVAGASGLDRLVTRVSVLEMPGGHELWSRGGELFMSTLFAYRGNCNAQVNVLRNMDQNNAAAFCLHPGLDGPHFLDELAAVADECGLPMILMPRDMPYAVVTDAVVGGLRGRQAALIQRSAMIHRELIQLTLRGEDLDSLCRAVSRRTRRPVAVVGPDGMDVLAHGGSLPGAEHAIDELLRYRSRFSNQRNVMTVPIHSMLATGGPDYVLKTTIAAPFGSITQVAAPVVAGSEIAAYLVTWELGEPLTEFDLSVLAHACTSVGLVVLRRRAVVEAEQRVQQDFYGDAISGKFSTVEAAEYRAEAARVTLPDRFLVAAVDCDQPPSDVLMGELKRWPGSVAVAVGNMHALVLHVPVGERQPVERAVELLSRTNRSANAVGSQCRIGVSSVVSSAMELPLAFGQAQTALSTADQLDLREPVTTYDDLGVFQLLGQVRDLSLVREFTSAILERVLALRGGDELARTLEAYLDHHGSHIAAAEVLFVHPNTVKYRIERIRELLGADSLIDPHRRLGMHIALKLRHLLD